MKNVTLNRWPKGPSFQDAAETGLVSRMSSNRKAECGLVQCQPSTRLRKPFFHLFVHISANDQETTTSTDVGVTNTVWQLSKFSNTESVKSKNGLLLSITPVKSDSQQFV